MCLVYQAGETFSGQEMNSQEKTARKFRSELVPRPRGAGPLILPPGFRSNGQVELEIGCGVGMRPIRYALAQPERYLIAIEHTRQRFAKFRSRLDHHPPIPNLLPLHADAVEWVAHCLGNQKLSRIWILYPNPNPKAASKRWIRMPFFQCLLESLAPEGEIVFSTNEEWYIREVKHHAIGQWGLSIVNELAFDGATAPAGYPRTHFEKKYLERGQRCFEVTLSR